MTASTPLRRLYGFPLGRPIGLLRSSPFCKGLTTCSCEAPLVLLLSLGCLPPLKIPQRLATAALRLLSSPVCVLLLMRELRCGAFPFPFPAGFAYA